MCVLECMCVKGNYCHISKMQGSLLPSQCYPTEQPLIEGYETSASYHPELTGVLVRRICDVNSELHLLTSLTGQVAHNRQAGPHSQPPPAATDAQRNQQIWNLEINISSMNLGVFSWKNLTFTKCWKSSQVMKLRLLSGVIIGLILRGFFLPPQRTLCYSSKITQKVLNRFKLNFQEMLIIALELLECCWYARGTLTIGLPKIKAKGVW